MTEPEFQLPARRELPEDIRERMRATVRMRLDDPQFEPQGRGRRFLAAAAAILVVAVGAAVVIQSVQDGDEAATHPSSTTSPPPTTDGSRAYWGLRPATENNRVLADQCWQAARQSEHAHRYPARREQWEIGGQINNGEVTQLSLRLGDQVAACEVSATTVWLSAPTPMLQAGDAREFEFLMLTPNGSGAITTRPDLGQPLIGIDQSANGGRQWSQEADPARLGVYFTRPYQDPVDAKVHIGIRRQAGTAGAAGDSKAGTSGDLPTFRDTPFPAPPAPLVTHRFGAIPAKGTTPADRRLTQCIDHTRASHLVMVDVDHWRPGAYAELGQGYAVQLAHHAHTVAACTLKDGEPVEPMAIRQGPREASGTVSSLITLNGSVPQHTGVHGSGAAQRAPVAAWFGATRVTPTELTMRTRDGQNLPVTLGPGNTYLVPLPKPSQDVGGVRFRLTDGTEVWDELLLGD